MPTNRRYPLADIMGALREAFPYDKRKVRYGGGWRLTVVKRLGWVLRSVRCHLCASSWLQRTGPGTIPHPRLLDPMLTHRSTGPPVASTQRHGLAVIQHMLLQRGNGTLGDAP